MSGNCRLVEQHHRFLLIRSQESLQHQETFQQQSLLFTALSVVRCLRFIAEPQHQTGQFRSRLLRRRNRRDLNAMIPAQHFRHGCSLLLAAPGTEYADCVQRRKLQIQGLARVQRFRVKNDSPERCGPCFRLLRLRIRIRYGDLHRTGIPYATAAPLLNRRDSFGNIPDGTHTGEILQIHFDAETGFQRIGDDRQTAGANGQIVPQIHIRFDFVAFVAGGLQDDRDHAFQRIRIHRRSAFVFYCFPNLQNRIFLLYHQRRKGRRSIRHWSRLRQSTFHIQLGDGAAKCLQFDGRQANRQAEGLRESIPDQIAQSLPGAGFHKNMNAEFRCQLPNIGQPIHWRIHVLGQHSPDLAGIRRKSGRGMVRQHRNLGRMKRNRRQKLCEFRLYRLEYGRMKRHADRKLAPAQPLLRQLPAHRQGRVRRPADHRLQGSVDIQHKHFGVRGYQRLHRLPPRMHRKHRPGISGQHAGLFHAKRPLVHNAAAVGECEDSCNAKRGEHAQTMPRQHRRF